jgi:hypothetical protein
MSETEWIDAPTSYETMPDGTQEPRWTLNNRELRVLDERMATAMKDRMKDRKRGITGPHLGWCPPLEEE